MLLKFAKYLLFLFLLLLCQDSHAQFNSSHFARNTDRIVIPFSFHYNYIIVNVRLYGAFELKFILDTGAEYSAITQKEVADLLGIQYSRKVNVLGADQKTMLSAFVGTGIDMNIEDLIIKDANILVLSPGFTQYDMLANMNISGILGADILSKYVVKIDYKKKVLVLQSNMHWSPPDDWQVLDVQMHKSKPYINLPVCVGSNTPINMKMLLDTGAGLPLLLVQNTIENLSIPETKINGRIGMGLGGFIEGEIARIQYIDLGKYRLKHLLTSFQNLDFDVDSTLVYKKNGIIGNDVMRLFDWQIDYQNQKCYIRPNKDFAKAPVYDKSGLVLMAFGPDLKKYMVIDIIPGSAAFLADVRKGDTIKSINKMPAWLVSFEYLTMKLSKKEGNWIKLKIKRNGKTLHRKFQLKNIL